MSDTECVERVAIVPIYSDSSGRESIPCDAICYGPRHAIMGRMIDSRARSEALAIINDATFAKRDLQAIRAEKADLAKRADAITQAEDLIRKLCSGVADLSTRLDAIEEEQRARAEAEERERNEEPITYPPGYESNELSQPAALPDSGELQTPVESDPSEIGAHPPGVSELELEPEPSSMLLEDADGDGDPGAVLPQAPLPLPDPHYNPDPDPVSKLNL